MTVITRSNSPYKVSNGVTDTGDVVSSGGRMIVLAGGTADLTTINSGGTETVFGTNTSAAILQGGHAVISTDGTDSGTVISTGGQEVIVGGGQATNISVGGQAVVSSGGVLLDAIIEGGGTASVFGVGRDANAVVGSGGVLRILAGGLATGDTIDNGGTIVVSPHGNADATEIDEGGSAIVAGAGTLSLQAFSDPAYLSNSGTVDVADGAGLTLNGHVLNAGAIDLLDSSTGATLDIAGDVVLSGGGSVNLLGSNEQNLIQASNPGDTLTNVDDKITGSGLIGENNLILINDGIIDGNKPNGGLSIEGSADNFGTIEATASGSLALFEIGLTNDKTIAAIGAGAVIDVVEATLNNGPSGVVEALGSGADVILQSASMTGGAFRASGSLAIADFEASIISGAILSTAAGAVIAAGGGTTDSIDNVTIAPGSVLFVVQNTSLTLSGVIANSGGISAGGNESFDISGDVSLAGGGKLVLLPIGDVSIEGMGSAVLTNIGNTIAGAGVIGDGTTDLSLINSAVIDANTSSPLTLEPHQVDNFGKLEGTASGGLVISCYLENSGGKIEALGAEAKVLVSDSVSGGIVGASGAGAEVVLAGAEILDGTLQASNGGAIVVESGGEGTLADEINGGLVEVANLGTLAFSGEFFTNNGTVKLLGSNTALLEIVSDLTLSGSGTLDLAPVGNGFNRIAAGNPNVTLTNDSHIVGAGYIGAGSDNLILVNNEIILGNGADGLIIAGSGTDINYGTIESTEPINAFSMAGGILIGADFINFGKIEAVGARAAMLIDQAITNSGSGIVFATGPAVEIELYSATISGGTVETAGGAAIVTNGGPATIASATIATGSLLEVTSSGSLAVDGGTLGRGGVIGVTSGSTLMLTSVTVSAGATVKVADGSEAFVIDGTIGANALVETQSGGTAIVAGAVTNSGTLYAAASGSLLEFEFAEVTGGLTEIGNGSAVIFGGEAVAFVAGGTGVLELLDKAGDTVNYSGRISGFGQNTHQVIDLINVTSAADITFRYISSTANNTSGFIAVSSGSTTVADITLVGHYTSKSFVLRADSSGDVEIVDPPVTLAGGIVTSLAATATTASLINTTAASNAALFGSYMAALFAATEGGIDTPTENGAGNQVVLAHPHAG